MSGTGVVILGGSGLLGTELAKLLPRALRPLRSEVDVTDLTSIRSYLDRYPVESVLHAAAFTSPPAVDRDPMPALATNIVGTANVVIACSERSLRLVYISTDYVFRGDRGNYAENDAVHPVNRYAWSKLGGECAARMYDRSLIVRTSFGPDRFPHPRALVDQWTSRQSVGTIAGKLAALLEGPPLFGVVHLGGPRRTVFELARSFDSDRQVGRMSRDELEFDVPRDTSLNCERYRRWVTASKDGGE